MMSSFSRIRLLLFVFLPFLTISGIARDYSSKEFYKHFNGRLDTAIHISMDMFSQNGKITGFYYYYFPDPGNPARYYFGKTIPLEGSLTGSAFILNEFSREGSSFQGIFESDSVITGTWQRKANDRAIPFRLKEDYTGGSTPFLCYSLSDQKYIMKEDRIMRNSPKAKINLLLFYPDLAQGNPVKETIENAIMKFVYNDEVQFSSPNLMLESIAADFFNSYFTATDGVEAPESRALFHWEKNIMMNICYNEKNIISLKIEKTAYTGGSHSITMTEYIVCDLIQRKRLTLDDIFAGNYKDRLDKILNEKIRTMNGIRPVENLSQTGFFMDQIECTENFYINKDGIYFYYNLYHIASYNAGTTEIFIPFTEVHTMFKENISFSCFEELNGAAGKEPY